MTVHRPISFVGLGASRLPWRPNDGTGLFCRTVMLSSERVLFPRRPNWAPDHRERSLLSATDYGVRYAGPSRFE